MEKQKRFWSSKRRWVLDAILGLSAVIVFASSIYFLYLPNGYQGGRNPYYDVVILFAREAWDLLHTWGGIAMIFVAAMHVAVHRKWFIRMARRTWQEVLGKTGKLNTKGRINLWANFLLAVSFVICSISGIYFMFVPSGSQALDPMILFSRTIWDMIHTWTGVLMILSALAHFIIHWKWVVNHTLQILQAGLAVFRKPSEQLEENVVTL